jgi:hypothetical protein
MINAVTTVDGAIVLPTNLRALRAPRACGERIGHASRGMSDEDRKTIGRGLRPFATQAESPASKRAEGAPFPVRFG